jgi:hypothetical protein
VPGWIHRTGGSAPGGGGPLRPALLVLPARVWVDQADPRAREVSGRGHVQAVARGRGGTKDTRGELLKREIALYLQDGERGVEGVEGLEAVEQQVADGLGALRARKPFRHDRQGVEVGREIEEAHECRHPLARAGPVDGLTLERGDGRVKAARGRSVPQGFGARLARPSNERALWTA